MEHFGFRVVTRLESDECLELVQRDRSVLGDFKINLSQLKIYFKCSFSSRLMDFGLACSFVMKLERFNASVRRDLQ